MVPGIVCMLAVPVHLSLQLFLPLPLCLLLPFQGLSVLPHGSELPVHFGEAGAIHERTLLRLLRVPVDEMMHWLVMIVVGEGGHCLVA
jgi:hypothetical protein